MKEFKIYILLLLAAIFSCCERLENPEDFMSKEVKLFARMGVHLTATQQTKGEGVITSSTNSQLNIGVVRLDQTDLSYPYFKNINSPLKATISKPNPQEGNLRSFTYFSTSQFFKNSSDTIRYAAWYPVPENNAVADGYNYSSGASGTTITYKIPSTGDSDIMYSNVVKGTMTTGFEVMQFNHALSLFRIHIYRSTELNWGELESVSINGLPDVCTITLPSGNSSPNHNIVYSKTPETDGVSMSYNLPSGEKEIPIGFENKKFIKEWIGAPEEYFGDGNIKILNITAVTSDGADNTIGNHNISVASNFKPGYAYDIILRFSDDGTVNSEVKIEDWEKYSTDIHSDINTSNIFYNLSSNGTANCYIVSSANFSYSFDATIKGNGNTAAMPGNRLDPTLAPKTVGIIWSEVPQEHFQLETNKIVEGKVLFTVKGSNVIKDKTLKSEGNVLLGVYDENGKCIWTWHIWITDRPQKQNYTKGYIALDRNLGATAAAPEGSPISPDNMNGLFYQWGRPTPFRLKTQGGEKVVDAEKIYERIIPDDAVANPTVFYGTFENPEQPGSTTNFHDWVDRQHFTFVNNLWGYREQEHQQPIKTIYDPCPAGYHVPYSRNWGNLEKYWVDKDDFDTEDEREANWDKLTCIKLEIEGTAIWYPFQGYINKDGEYKSGHMHIGPSSAIDEDTRIVEVWSSLINRHDDEDSGLGDEKVNDSPYRFMFTKDEGSMLSDTYSNRSRGLAVRCVSDNTSDVVKDLSASQSANCYMVHENGYYKFKTSVRGNGVGSLLPLGGSSTAEINGGLSTTISPARVDILWWQGDFTNGTVDFPENEIASQTDKPENMCLSLLDNGNIGSDGYVSFVISNFSKGNVILAAYDENDIILWTWHIWLTDKPVDKISGNYTKMDRFLGATYAPVFTENVSNISWPEGGKQATLGFYYQWGRKDPIIGPRGVTSGTDNSNETATTVPSSGWWIKNGENWSYRKSIDVRDKAYIPEVVKNPTAFYRGTADEGQSCQWFPDNFADGYTNVAMWGYAVADYSLEGQTFSKTMHDPCPPGYRTPFHFAWRYDSSYKYAEGDAGEATTRLGNNETGWDNNGIVTNKTHFEKMWFPFTGYRDPQTGGYTNVGSYGYMNTGMPMGQYNTRSFWYNDTYTGQYAGRHGSAYGKMVRCMKE